MQRLRVTRMLGLVGLAGLIASSAPSQDAQSGGSDSAAALRDESQRVRGEVADAEEKDRALTSGLIKSLVGARIETLKITEALLDQRVLAVEGGIPLSLEAPATAPDSELAASLEGEITQAEVALDAARREAARFSGGLIQVLKASTVATQEQTLAMLRLRYLTAKYGLAPLALTTEARPDPPTSSRVANSEASGEARPTGPVDQPGNGPFGFTVSLSKEDIEKLLGTALKEVDGQSHLFYAQSAPRPHPRFKAYALRVLPQSGLCEIRAVGADVSTSSHGTQLRAAFADLRDTLLLTGSIWNDPEDWMMGLLKNERYLQAAWDSESNASLKNEIEDIILGARARSRDTGYLMLQYKFTNHARCTAEAKRLEQDVF